MENLKFMLILSLTLPLKKLRHLQNEKEKRREKREDRVREMEPSTQKHTRLAIRKENQKQRERE